MNGTFNLFRDEGFEAVFVANTPEEIIATARHYNERKDKPRAVKIPSSDEIACVDRLIVGGARHREDIAQAMLYENGSRGEFNQRIGRPGNPIRERVELAPGVEILLGGEEVPDFRRFAVELEADVEMKGMNSRRLKGAGGLYFAHLFHEPKFLAYHQVSGNGQELPKDTGFGTGCFERIYLPENLMKNIALTGLRYINDRTKVLQQVAQPIGQEPRENQWMGVLRQIFR